MLVKTKRTKTVTITTKTLTRTSFTAGDLREALDLPPHAKISIYVPHGGDFSGEDLELGGHQAVKLDVEWEETTDSQSERTD